MPLSEMRYYSFPANISVRHPYWRIWLNTLKRGFMVGLITPLFGVYVMVNYPDYTCPSGERRTSYLWLGYKKPEVLDFNGGVLFLKSRRLLFR